VLHKLIEKARPKVHVGHNVAHLLYFGAVFVEGHGLYATMGGVLLIVGAVAMFVGEE